MIRASPNQYSQMHDCGKNITSHKETFTFKHYLEIYYSLKLFHQFFFH